jgi:23S rRNA pseudouridine1911/1915/1917 synthase
LRVDISGIRLDKYLATRYPGLSRSVIQKLIRQNAVLVNGQSAKASQELHSGDTIQITFPQEKDSSPQPEPIPLKILYEDDDIIVLDKPAGLTVHPAPGHTSHTLVNALLAYHPEMSGLGDPERPGIVHRLDKDTSGLMIVARHSSAQQYLIKQFKAHTVVKRYSVLVQGKLEPERGIIEAPIGRDPYHRKKMAVVEEGRFARTTYTVKEYLGNYTLIEAVIETGRTHQIRVHLAAIGHPVAGDRVYGKKASFVERQFVHAYKLRFTLPSDGSVREFSAELPADLSQALEYLRRSR